MLVCRGHKLACGLLDYVAFPEPIEPWENSLRGGFAQQVGNAVNQHRRILSPVFGRV